MLRKKGQVGLMLLLIISALFLTAFALPESTQISSLAAQPIEGQPFTAADWVAHLPLACATVGFVIVVNAIFMGIIVHNRRRIK